MNAESWRGSIIMWGAVSLFEVSDLVAFYKRIYLKNDCKKLRRAFSPFNPMNFGARGNVIFQEEKSSIRRSKFTPHLQYTYTSSRWLSPLIVETLI